MKFINENATVSDRRVGRRVKASNCESWVHVVGNP